MIDSRLQFISIPDCFYEKNQRQSVLFTKVKRTLSLKVPLGFYQKEKVSDGPKTKNFDGMTNTKTNSSHSSLIPLLLRLSRSNLQCFENTSQSEKDLICETSYDVQKTNKDVKTFPTNVTKKKRNGH